MGERVALHKLLVAVTANVYFQPPPSVKIEYPCIIYKRDTIKAKFANNATYSNKTRYQVTAIDRDPDVAWQSGLLDLPLCRHIRNFATEGLNHDVFEIYY